ncbi:MAG: 4Fe-4S dicluster domain-containing protein [Candidatus Altiarchaeota archaeon]
MEKYILHRENLEKFINSNAKKFQLIAPVKKDDIVVFEEIKDFSELTLDYINTKFPLRKYFLPTPEEALRYRQISVTPIYDNTKRLIFGVRPCDVNALLHQDQVLLDDEYIDPYFKKRRENNLIISLQCWRSGEDCFCTSMGTEKVEDGYDLLFTEIDAGYLVQVGSPKGQKLIKSNSKLFKKTSKTAQIKLRCSKKLPKKDIGKLNEFENFHSSVWETHAQRCLSCCACTTTCPTCKCFGIRDIINLDLKSGSRIREQQSCQLKVFTVVAGEHVFRDERDKRLKQRIMHKLNYHAITYGNQLCVGCGRCITNCPTKIDMTEIVGEI